MSACPRCGRFLTRREALEREHRCADGYVSEPCGSLDRFVDPDYHRWLHDWAFAFDAEIFMMETPAGGQPYLWQIPYPRVA